MPTPFLAVPGQRQRHSIASTFVALLLIVGAIQPALAQDTPAVTFAYWGDPAEAAAYETVITSFEAQNPGINVDGQYTPGKSDYQRRISTAFAGNQAPDVFLVNYREYGQFADTGALEPLGPMLAESDTISEDDFYPIALDAFRYNGDSLTCIPQNISSLVVYYNVDLFTQAGIPLPTENWTLDDFTAAASALTQDTNGDGTTDIYGLVTESSLIRYAPFIWGMGGEVVDDTDNPTKLMLDTPEARAGIDWFTSLGEGDLAVVPTRAEVLAEDDLSRFMNGRAAMYFQSRRVVPTLREIDSFQWDVAPLPQGDEPAGILHSDALCMNANAKDKDAAWAFIEYALGPEGQTELATTGRTVPSLTAIAESPVFLDPKALPKHSQVFLDAIPALRRLPSIGAWPEVEDIFNAEFQEALYADFDVDAAIGTTQDRANAVLSRGNAGESATYVALIGPRWKHQFA